MSENPRLNTITGQRTDFSSKNSTLKELQLNLINSLSKSPIASLRGKSPISTHHIDDDFDEYINKIQNSLSKYQVQFVPPKNYHENDLGPNEKYMDKEGKNLIKKVHDLNQKTVYLESSTLNDDSKLKVIIPEKPQYPNPYQSLGVIKSNKYICDEISKDYLFRQSDVFNKKITDIQKYKSKYSVKMPKINVTSSNNKGMFDGPILDMGPEKGRDVLAMHIPSSGGLKLFCYYKYPNKNFPEGREQFSLFSKGNELIISGGISTNMKSLAVWGLNLETLEWGKINSNGMTNNRYGHTSIFYQNKLYFFGGKSKYQNLNLTCGLEVLSLSDHIYTIPITGKVNPEPRRNHTAELIGNQMLIFGGISENNEILSDCYLLNFNPLSWNIAVINKYAPAPKVFGHSSCLVIPRELLNKPKFSIYSYPTIEPGKGNNLIKEKGIYIFGGKTKEDGGLSNQLWILVTGKKPMNWILPQTKGRPPSPRYFHSMSFYEKGNFLIIHGGRNDNMSESSALNDTFVFDLENFEWLRVELYFQSPGFSVLSRCGHQSAIFKNKLIIVGGMNNKNYVGSTLLIVNLDFSYHAQPKTMEEIMLKQLEEKDDPESRRKAMKLRNELKHNQLGVVTNITLPPIK